MQKKYDIQINEELRELSGTGILEVAKKALFIFKRETGEIPDKVIISSAYEAISFPGILGEKIEITQEDSLKVIEIVVSGHKKQMQR